MHFLESLTFVPKIQDAIIKEFRAARRMFPGEFRETPGKFVARFRHGSPPCGNFFQIVFFANAQGNRPIHTEKLLLEVAGFGIKRPTQISGNFAQSSIRFFQSCSRQLQHIRSIETCAHFKTTVIRNPTMSQDSFDR